MKSKYVCKLCGLTVGHWYGTTWKHQAGPGQKSCGKTVQPIERTIYESSLNDALRAVLHKR